MFDLKKIALLFVIISVLMATGLTQKSLKMASLDFQSPNLDVFVPKASFVKPMMLGHEALLSDLIWIKTLGYFADEISSGGKLKYLEKLIDLATDLDPRFDKVYMWAGAATIYNSGRITKDKIRSSNRILEKGWKFIQSDALGYHHHPEYWMIPQMIGFNYAVELRDKQKGAPFIEAASKIPGVPEQFKTWSAYLYNKAGQTQKAIDFLEKVLAAQMLKSRLDESSSLEERSKIKAKLKHYYLQINKPKDYENRVDQIQSNMARLYKDWFSHYYFVDFNFYLLLRDDLNVSSSNVYKYLW